MSNRNDNEINLEWDGTQELPVPPSGTVYTLDGQELVEVEIDDDIPPDDDDTSTIWTDADVGEEDFDEDEPSAVPVSVNDMAFFTFTSHTDSVYCVDVHSKINGLVITGGGDDRAFIWKYDGRSGELESSHELKGHTDTVTTVGFNFDGTLALTGSYDGTVRIWSVSTGEQKLILEGPEDVEWAEWHSKGNAVVAGSKDGTIWMWLAHNGQCVQVFAGHEGSVCSGCFTKDGKMVCSGGEDGTVRVWAPKTGLCKHVFEGHSGHEATVTCIASNTDGDLLLTGSVDGTVKLLQISGKRVLHTFVHSLPGSANLTTGGGSGSNLYGITEESDDIDDANIQGDAANSVECVGLSGPEYRWAASGGMDNNLKVWDIVSGFCRCVCTHRGCVVSLTWHSSLPVIATAALDNVVRLWDARAGALLVELTGHTNLVTYLTMAPLVQLDDTSSTDAVLMDVAEEQQQHQQQGEALIASEVDRLPPHVYTAATTTAPIRNNAAGCGSASDVLVSVSDDRTARVFHVDVAGLLRHSNPPPSI